MELDGTIDPRFEALAERLGAQLDAGYDLGASLAVSVDGELVVDCWGGWVDADRTRPWGADTITNVYSTTKTMTALAALAAIDRGLIDPDERVATYWPEFAANGKEQVLVRHLLSHTSGVSAWERPVDAAVVYDPVTSVERLAAQAPWWEPGTASGYHLMAYGHLIGEVVRRADGRDLATFFAEEIADPLDADFTIGSPEENWGRIAPVIPPPPPVPQADPTEVAIKSFLGPMLPATESSTPEWRRAVLGGANGHGNARSVARIQSIVANGGTVGGTRLLGAETIDRIFEEQSNGIDLVLGQPFRFGIGYALPCDRNVMGIEQGRRCYWGGWGGSIVVNDVENRSTIAYVMNRMQPGILGNDTSIGLVADWMDVLDA